MKTTNPVADFFSPEVIDNPYPLYARLRAEGPVSFIPSLDVWMVTNYQACLEVLRDPQVFNQWDGSELMQGNPEVQEELAIMFGLDPATAPKGGLRELAAGSGLGMMADTLVTANPPEHTRYRSMTNQAWSAKRTADDAEPRIREVITECVDAFAGDGKVELMSRLAGPLPALVIAELLGAPRSDWHKFEQWSQEALTLLGGNLTREQVRPAVTSMMSLVQYLGEQFAQRRAEPRDDAFTALLNTRDPQGEGLNDVELLSIGLHLLAAGHETTINGIGNTMWTILREPGVRDELLDDPSLIPNAVAESLRIESPVQFLFRQVVQDRELAGVQIPSGARVAAVFASANRDGAMFPDPDRFDIRRANARQHLSFGFGIHRCVGEPLSLRELQLTVELLLNRLPNLRLAPGQSFEHNPHPFLRRLKELHLEFDNL